MSLYDLIIRNGTLVTPMDIRHVDLAMPQTAAEVVVNRLALPRHQCPSAAANS